MKDGNIEFELKDGKISIATYQNFEPEKFINVVLSMIMKMHQLQAQKDYFNAEILRNEKAIEDAKVFIENSAAASLGFEADIEKAKKFLQSIHREDLILKIDKKAEEQIKEMEEQMKRQENQLG